MKWFFSLTCVLLLGSAYAQQFTWSGQISNIIYDNCSSCHHDGGIAPFSLMNYDQASSYPVAMEHVVTERIMPPWPADPNVMHFANEAYLSEDEIMALQWWLQNDMPIGDIEQAPDPPVFPESGSLLETIDFTLEIEPYTLSSNSDEFRWFVFENPYDQDIYISKLEVDPGLETVVHHADLFYDLTGASMNLDNQDPLSGFGGNTGFPTNSYYINAWQPGGNIAEYPNNWGIRVPPNADFVIEIHYGPGGMGQTDNTKMNLQFLVDPVNPREVSAGWLMGHNAPTLIDGPLFIPANEEAIFHQVTAPLANDLSVISICPHMHFIGKSYKVWYTDPDGIDHDLIDIPRWDLHWQKYYVFQTIKHIPAGSVLKSEGVYDNTLNNHDNPYDPPQDVGVGLGTLDEMFLCYFIYANYQTGDEYIIMDEDYVGINEQLELSENFVSLYPNPTETILKFATDKTQERTLSFAITNALGQVVINEVRSNDSTFWETEFDVSDFPSGLYYFSFFGKDVYQTERFVRQ